MDPAYLNAEERAYPVTVDPSFTIDYSGIQDATIFSNSSVNDGLSGSIFVGNFSARHGGSKGVARTLVKFPGLMGNPVFASLTSDQISSMIYYIRDLMCEVDGVAIDCYRATSYWTETGVKCNGTIWNAYTAKQDSKTVRYQNGESGPGSGGTGGHWYGFNLTNLAKSWKNGTVSDYGIMLKAANESQGAKTFASADRSDYKPRVIVQYYDYAPPSGTVSQGPVTYGPDGEETGEKPLEGRPVHSSVVHPPTGFSACRVFLRNEGQEVNIIHNFVTKST